jgi:hypothetical protein
MPATGDIFQATFQSSIQGQVIENVLHFRALDGTVTDGAIDTALNLFGTNLCNLWVTSQINLGIIVKRLTPLPLDERLVTPTTATGQQSAAPLNQTVALVLTKRTGLAGKSHRGRMYVSAIPSNFTTDGCRFNPTGAGIIGTFCTNIIAHWGPSGDSTALRLGVYSGKIGGLTPPTLAGWQQITTLEPQIIFGNQRRRRVGVGI